VYKKSVVILLAIVVAISLIGVAFRSGSSKEKADLVKKNKIAVIYVDGIIMGGRGQGSLFSESGGTDNLIKQLHQARDDKSVAAVVLRINSPGGSATASQEVGEELKKMRALGKVVVTSMGDMAASGGYWLAACTDKIYANPSTLTGSIGVYMPYANWEELYKKIGIQQEKIKSGPHKDIMSPERKMTESERVIIQTMVDDMYNQFVNIVAEGRHLDPTVVRQIADGRVYTGNQAKQLGLIDEFGNMYDAIDGAKAIVGVKDPVIKEFGKTSPLEMLLGAKGNVEVSKLLLEKLFSQQSQNNLPIVAPLAMPEQWQVIQ
jgi:protease-4